MNSVCCTFSSWQMIANLCSFFCSLSLISPAISPFHSKSPHRFASYAPYSLFSILLIIHYISAIFCPHFHLSLPHPAVLPVPQSASSLQALTCSPTARRSARPWVIPTAAGCRPSCRPMGARGRTTAATCTCPAWTPRCPTLRYPPLSTSPTKSP